MMVASVYAQQRLVLFLAALLSLFLITDAFADNVFSNALKILPPKPVPADHDKIPAAFRKIVPGSVSDLKQMEEQTRAILPRISPTVVAVEVGEAAGSGVIISPDGLVLTAGHVCGWPQREAKFTFPNGRTVYGITLGVSHVDDTGLMRITNSGTWPCAEVADLKDEKVGDWTLALGHPGGFDLKRSLVVRLGRIIRLDDDMIQTDCTISPGDSGGPLFDMQGRVMAVHVAISEPLTDNFHVPVSLFYTNWDLLASGRTEVWPNELADSDEGRSNSIGQSYSYGSPPNMTPHPNMFGITPRTVKSDPPMPYVGATVKDDASGCRLDTIEEHSPAAIAGLKTGDIVLEIEGRTIKFGSMFWRWMDECGPGATVHVEVKRGEEMLTLPMKLASPQATK